MPRPQCQSFVPWNGSTKEGMEENTRHAVRWDVSGKLEMDQKSFLESLLFPRQLRWPGRRGRVQGPYSTQRASHRVLSSHSRKIRSEWFEFLSRKTNGRRDFGILMRHGEHRGRSPGPGLFLYSRVPRARGGTTTALSERHRTSYVRNIGEVIAKERETETYRA